MSVVLYSAELPFIEERGNQVVFGGTPPRASWGPGHPDHRPIEAGELVIDRRYWELLGEPDKLVVGFANEAGWQKWVGDKPWAGPSWLEPFTKEADNE